MHDLRQASARATFTGGEVDRDLDRGVLDLDLLGVLDLGDLDPDLNINLSDGSGCGLMGDLDLLLDVV